MRLSHCQLWLLALTFCPHITILPENGNFSSCLAYCNWVSGKKKVTITSFRVEIFKNIGFPWTCGRTKKEVVVPVYGSWIIYILLPLTTLSYFHRFFAFCVDGRKRFQYATCGRVFFFATKKEEKISVFRNIRIHVDTLNVTSYFIKSKKEYF